ncbi:hypothetical protein VNI00_004724 [Paramarasmius palmivorus]|uniref:Uncharacterized protein n=1 Tax=Paramarasmius palmivorus TaxID=297713 RepID=A0AAW0DKD5_9AGAR
MSIEIPDNLHCVVFPVDIGCDKIGSTNVFEGPGAGANDGIEEDPDFIPITELDAKLREREYVPEEGRKLLEPKFSAQFDSDSAAGWEKYFMSDAAFHMVKPFDILAYQKALLLSEGRLIGDDAYGVCLICYVH